MKLPYLILIWMLLIQTSFSCIFTKPSGGVIKGRIAKITGSNKHFYAFQEIPYAAPPVGNLRFQPPQPVPEWKGVRDTTKNTKICYQIGSNSSMESEDCLYLNVYTPTLPRRKNPQLLPVMVYFHGGGFVIGDAVHKSYGPEFLVNHDVVIVTLNYRLGVFGFLSTQDETIPGNNGLKDQLFALQWVNQNIHLFGGNSSEITIFGQSAGAASVSYHLISQRSRGLYRGAIMESSCALNPFAYQRSARFYAYKLASYINDNITEENTTEEQLLEFMVAASTSDIHAAADRISSEETYYNAQLFQGYYFAPVIEVESEGAFLTEKMFEVVNRGDAAKVPVIMGINSEESLSQTTDLVFLKRLMSAYDNDLKALVPNDMNTESEDSRTEAGEDIRILYSGDNLLQNVSAAGVRYMSDTMFTRAVIKYASLQSQYSDVYFYLFSYDGKMGNVSIIVEGAEKVGHNEEIAYLWRVQNDMFDNYNLAIFPEADIVTHDRLLMLWTNFAKTLNPTPVDNAELLQNIKWPTVTADNSFPFLQIGENLEIKNRPKEESFSGWEEIYSKYGRPPYDTY